MEKSLILALTLLALAIGSGVAVLRPGLYRLGQPGSPVLSPGTSILGSSRSGRWQPAPYRRAWGAFQGRR
jgi:hypothetical protein